jgi:hypothetical protein
VFSRIFLQLQERWVSLLLACSRDHLDLSKWLYQVDKTRINIHK